MNFTQTCTVPPRGVATAIAEPLLACVAVHDACWIVDTAIAVERKLKGVLK